MNLEERQEFWNTLANIKSYTQEKKLKMELTYPDKFYRYRSVSIPTLNSIAYKEIKFSTSNYYDDPFDTFIYIDYDKIKNATGKTIEALKDIRNTIRKNLWSICFTEDYSNEVLWLKYANEHKGIVLEYSADTFKPMIEDVVCDISMYPVVYSDSSYNSTDVIKFIIKDSSNENLEICKEFLTSGFYILEMKKILLKKKRIHSYDKEWRLILIRNTLNNEGSRCTLGNIKPTKIILGLKISDDDKKAVLMAAEKAGIENIEQMIINDNDEFVAQKI